MPTIVTLTLNPAIDKTCSVTQVVAENKLRCRDVELHAGGGGINVARAATKLGADTLAIWARGGHPGAVLQNLLDKEGIQQTAVSVANMTRENLIVFEESSEQQYRFGMPGARLTVDEVENCVEQLNRAVCRCAGQHVEGPETQSADRPRPGGGGSDNSDDSSRKSAEAAETVYVVLSGSLPPGCANGLYGQIIEELPSYCRVILDTSGQPLQEGVTKGVYLIKPNKRELGQLAGEAIEDDSQIRDVARRLVDDGRVEVVVTSLGSGGAVLTTSEIHEHIRTPTVDIRSKVGAGDSMVAGIVVALSRNQSLFEAASFGVAAGAAAVMTEGTELCRRSDTERLFGEMLSERE